MANALTAQMRSSSVALKRLCVLSTIAGSAVLANPAFAQDIYNFTYTFADNQYETGSLTGTLASDGNHFTVTGGTFSYNGVPAGSYGLVESLDTAVGGGPNSGFNNNGTAVVTLDKSYLDFYAEDFNFNGTYFGLNDNYFGAGGIADADAFNESEGFDAARFTASVVTAAPEPSPWALMILGFGIAGLALRRRQQVALRIAYA